MSEKLRIIYAATEVEGFSKSGGLADVSRALPLHLKQQGHDIRIVTPFYSSISENHVTRTLIQSLGVPLGGEEIRCAVRELEMQGTVEGENVTVPVYFIEHEDYFFRSGYYDDGMLEYPDNAERFGFFSKSALQLCRALKWIPHIFHANDWHTALIPYYLFQEQEAGTELLVSSSVLTVHNSGYQGNVPGRFSNSLDIYDKFIVPEIFEDHGQLNLLKGGISFADQVNTVSQGYAEELKTPLGSHGLHEIYADKGNAFSGILNGCDYEEWNPESDPSLPECFSINDLAGKKVCKQKLQQTFGLPESSEVAVIGMVSRLTWQKGFEYLIPALQDILRLKVQLIILGSGELWIASSFDKLKEQFPEKLGWKNGHDNYLAHLIEAGSDLYLMPSLYEPCGLNQMYSLRYGTLPIVRNVGGLKDTVINYQENSQKGNGFIFEDPNAEAVAEAVDFAVKIFYRKPARFRKMIERAMKQRFTWTAAAEKYSALYQKTLNQGVK